jgi:hypothetical protein
VCICIHKSETNRFWTKDNAENFAKVICAWKTPQMIRIWLCVCVRWWEAAGGEGSMLFFSSHFKGWLFFLGTLLQCTSTVKQQHYNTPCLSQLYSADTNTQPLSKMYEDKPSHNCIGLFAALWVEPLPRLGFLLVVYKNVPRFWFCNFFYFENIIHLQYIKRQTKEKAV